MTVKLSEMREGSMIDLNSEVFFKHQIVEMILKRENIAANIRNYG